MLMMVGRRVSERVWVALSSHEWLFMINYLFAICPNWTEPLGLCFIDILSIDAPRKKRGKKKWNEIFMQHLMWNSLVFSRACAVGRELNLRRIIYVPFRLRPLCNYVNLPKNQFDLTPIEGKRERRYKIEWHFEFRPHESVDLMRVSE